MFSQNSLYEREVSPGSMEMLEKRKLNMQVNMNPKPNFGIRMYQKAGKGGLFNPNHKPDTGKNRIIKVKPITKSESDSESEEVELKGQMVVIGRMFRKKLTEILNAKEEEKEKLDWFAKTRAKEAKEAADLNAIKMLAEQHTMLDKSGREVPAMNMFYLFHKYYKEKEAKNQNDMNATKYLMPKLKLETDSNIESFN